MKEEYIQPKQEKNLEIEKQEAIAMQDNAKAENIDQYRELATSKENMDKPNIENSEEPEKLKQEKEKVDAEIDKVQREIEENTRKLNELRAQLGMEPSEDIPSLMDKKAKLEDLKFVQDDLEAKLKDKEKQINIKENSDAEDSKLEMHHLKGSLEEVTSRLRQLMGELREREGRGLNQVFDNENLIGSAMQNLESVNDIKNLPEYLNKLSAGFNINYRGKGRFSENTDSLRKMAQQLNGVYSAIEVIPSKIQNEQEKGEVASLVNKVKNSIDEARSMLRNKAGQIDNM